MIHVVISECVSRHAELVKDLFQVVPSFEVTDDLSSLATTFEELCGAGLLRLCQWFVRVYPSALEYVNWNHAFHSACVGRHMSVAQWLASTRLDHIDVHSGGYPGLRAACRHGDVGLAEWLWSLYTRELEWQGSMVGRKIVNEAFAEACECNGLPVAHWLATTCPDLDPAGAFRFCEKLEVLRWLLKRFDTSVEKGEVDVNFTFYARCWNGNLQAAKMIFERWPEKVGDPQPAFEAACMLNTAKWLSETFHTLRPQLAFESACKDGPLETATWLSDTWPELVR